MPTPKVYDFTGTQSSGKDLFELDFKTDLSITLQKETAFNRGLPGYRLRPLSAVYYEEIVAGVYTNPICRLDWVFHDDEFGLVTRKEILLKHYNDDESLTGVIKDLGRSYDAVVDKEFRLNESKQRRQALLDHTNGDILRALTAHLTLNGDPSPSITGLQLGKQLLDLHDHAIHIFVHNSDYQILEDIAQGSTPWLHEPMLDPVTLAPVGMTIADYVVQELSPDAP